MAITKIHPIKSTLKKAIDYIADPAKTDDKLLVSSFGCAVETADLEFEKTRLLAMQKGNNLAHHLIQAFEPGEVSYAQAHEIGRQLADEILGGKYEYVIATHINKEHCHNHIIFCAVDFAEHTTALDVTIQAQILKLMDKLVKEQGASLILITHDLAVVSQMADRIIVMYCGKIVESGSRDDVIHRPSHPYTEGLLNSIPRMGEEQKRLESIPGMVPSMLDLPQGCYFAPRCKYCQDICRTVTPENHEVSPGHCAACHFPLTGGESHE